MATSVAFLKKVPVVQHEDTGIEYTSDLCIGRKLKPEMAICEHSAENYN